MDEADIDPRRQAVDPQRVVKIARSWIGTPYRHQASLRFAGTDCLGLIRGIWRELHGAEPEALPSYSADWSEPSGEERLWRAAERHLLRVDVAGMPGPGEVLLFRMRARGVAKHLGIASEQNGAPSLIHAFTGHHVVESALGPAWVKRIAARFAFPQGV